MLGFKFSKKQTFPFAVLLILDGWGIREDIDYNSILSANTPNIKYLNKHSFYTTLGASGNFVGLPEDTIGNSEVGHLNIGAGRIVLQDVLRVNREIDTGVFFKNQVLVNSMKQALDKNKNIHFMGLLSDGLVHSSLKHLDALLRLASKLGAKNKVFIDGITDGRDSNVDSSYQFINTVNESIHKYKTGKFSSIGGRYYAMDRDKRWDRIEKYYNTITDNAKSEIYETPIHGIKKSYDKKVSDEFIIPFRIKDTPAIQEGDCVIFFNFREDRAREITHTFVDESFNEFKREKLNINFVTLCEYEKELCENVAYPNEIIHNTLSEVISKNNFAQFKIAETEKYAHITYFLNGKRENEFPLEERMLIPSLKIPTYDLNPKMRVYEITDNLLKQINNKQHKLLIANFANADMVGHSGNFEATKMACEYIDECIGRVIKSTYENNGILFITADHGNAEIKFDKKTNEISTKHTTNSVPFYITHKDMTQREDMRAGKLADIVPTLLPYINIEKSKEMSGANLHT